MLPYSEAYSKARAAATKALEIDETLPQAHTALALVNVRLDWDWAGAEREYKRAIELNPNSAEAHGGDASYLGQSGPWNSIRFSRGNTMALPIFTTITTSMTKPWKRYKKLAIYRTTRDPISFAQSFMWRWGSIRKPSLNSIK